MNFFVCWCHCGLLVDPYLANRCHYNQQHLPSFVPCQLADCLSIFCQCSSFAEDINVCALLVFHNAKWRGNIKIEVKIKVLSFIEMIIIISYIINHPFVDSMIIIYKISSIFILVVY